jgi:hypothetical protein
MRTAIFLIVCLTLAACGVVSLGLTNSPPAPNCIGRTNTPGCP